MRDLEPGDVVQPVIGLAGQAFGAVVDIEQDGIESARMTRDHVGDIHLLDAHAGIAQAVAENLRHRASCPGNDRRHQLGHHNLRLGPKHLERGPQREAHAEATDQEMRRCDLLDFLRSKRRQRLFRARQTAVHQLVGAEHDRELAATPHQTQFIFGAGNPRGIDLFPWNDAAACNMAGTLDEGYPPAQTSST